MALLAALVTAAALPGFTPYATGPDGGIVLAGTFPGAARPGYVYLPPGYSRAQRYPVVYFLHGMPGSPSEYLYGTDLLPFADAAISSGRLRPFIGVMPAAGPDRDYNGEWAGPWEREVVRGVVPFIDTYLSTVAEPSGRVLAGLSAGGFGAVYIALRHLGLFGSVESWSGYFHPLHDGPFMHDSKAELRANDPRVIVDAEGAALRTDGTRFFLSSGPYHSHWFTPAETRTFASTLRALHLPVRTLFTSRLKGEWRQQLDTGLEWALAR
jgi:poly(3-hydroxybutyrate) depolymerase